MLKTTKQTLIYIGISLLLGLAAVMLALRWMDSQVASASTAVVVASSSISPGERIGSHNLRQVSWPVNAAISGTVSRVEALEGRVAVTGMQKGEPIIENRLAPQGSRAGLNALITPGYRAMTVKVNEIVGVAGFALPGNHVDILVTIQNGERQQVSKFVLEKILVLAVAQEHSVNDETKPKVVSAVTLEVTPEQAEKLDLARSIGSLSMVLRNQTDLASIESRGAKISDILGNPSPQPMVTNQSSQRVPPSSPSIELIRGVNRTSVSAS